MELLKKDIILERFTSNRWQHFKKILVHKYWVFHFACKCGIPWLGLIHDLSKFSKTEFEESVKFYTGKTSPLEEARKYNGYSNAWVHHVHRNPHHYHYWVDLLNDKVIPVPMPYKYTVEMLCDFLGAGIAYKGKDFTYDSEYKWWKSQKDQVRMHEINKQFIDMILFDLTIVSEDTILDEVYLKAVYNHITKRYYETRDES